MRNLFRRNGVRAYGGDMTIHQTTELDIETFNGEVVAVWFRCQPLPFNQSDASKQRADEMRSMYDRDRIPGLLGVAVVDDTQPLDQPQRKELQ